MAGRLETPQEQSMAGASGIQATGQQPVVSDDESHMELPDESEEDAELHNNDTGTPTEGDHHDDDAGWEQALLLWRSLPIVGLAPIKPNYHHHHHGNKLSAQERRENRAKKRKDNPVSKLHLCSWKRIQDTQARPFRIWPAAGRTRHAGVCPRYQKGTSKYSGDQLEGCPLKSTVL
ncbi:hypothetical protein HPB48_022173 [Haemaphysalis longicornis]|uniref:Uncharacterized protein n=1 Tax=Haemaphysalis longicornis TaxID=44386 RepID=A0A9J6GW15_HAELO|nr:hypothetical protein HPB48_022173 [Haemaphysalis longicornis]